MRLSKFILAVALVCTICACSDPGQVSIVCYSETPVLRYGIGKLQDYFNASGYAVVERPGSKQADKTVVMELSVADEQLQPTGEGDTRFEGIAADGFRIRAESDSVFILATTDKGCLYGMMELMEQLGPQCDFGNLEEHSVNPAFSFRAIKFNLPWAPYRPGPATDLHRETCRDPAFWGEFLDMMVENRFNALTLWSTHLFPYMIRAENYPDATPFSNRELQEWQAFWKHLFRMAKDRGIETYLVNWNIVVSEEFAANYGARVHDDRSQLVKQYTRESVTQLINEYEDLTGLGVTLADWMGNWGDDLMTPAEREDWIRETFVEGIRDADRPVKFIHRAVLAGDPAEMRQVIDYAGLPERTIVEVKFNWSHAHSSPNLSITHSNDAGTIMRGFWDPEPENYFIAWMMRNEDFFVLRWGDPDFIREHIRANHHGYVDGYFVGSEGYIPAMDYSHREHPHKTWDYAFQKQWLFYKLWGRLTYDPQEPDETFIAALETRYTQVDGRQMLEACKLASRVPMQLASFYKGTWDFTLYSEGFMAPWTIGYDDGESPFISLEELISHETLDPGYLSIGDYCRMRADGSQIRDETITPPELAVQLIRECQAALALIAELRNKGNDPALESELDDLETWCHLGFYFADKINAGVAFRSFRLSGNDAEQEMAIGYLENCIGHWENVVRKTAGRYKPMPYVSMGHHEQKWPGFTSFHWEQFLAEVSADLEYVRNAGP